MITPDAAAERLKAWSVDDRNGERFVPQIARLPDALRRTGFLLMGRRPDGQAWRHDGTDDPEGAASCVKATIEALPKSERLQLFRVFFPRLAEEVEATWHFLRRGPYLDAYWRCFRAPSHPAASLARRYDWLRQLVDWVTPLDGEVVTPVWLATWAAHVRHTWRGSETISPVLAAVLEDGDSQADEVFEILRQSATNEHEIGAMGSHIPQTLLMASRPAGWELVEKLLLAAQRQEGLRQSILAAVNYGHPQAFRRMLRLLCEHKLTRFAAVVQAANQWFGLKWEATQSKSLHHTLEHILSMFEDADARRQELAGQNAERAFLALWSLAFDDVATSIPAAAALLAHRQAEMRYVAAVHLGNLQLPAARRALVPALDDQNFHVALAGLAGGARRCRGDSEEGSASADESADRAADFEQLARLFARMPEKPRELPAIVWPWTSRDADRDDVGHALVAATKTSEAERLIPYLARVGARVRGSMIRSLAEAKPWTPAVRDALLDAAGDASGDVRQSALTALAKESLRDEEVQRLEALLSRKAADLRQAVVGIIVAGNDDAALASAERLLPSSNGSQRLAGLELLRRLAEADRRRSECQRRAAAFGAERKKLSGEEQTQVEAIAAAGEEKLTLANALGLMNPAERSPVVPPQRHDVQFITPAAIACLKSLDDLVHEHREAEIKLEGNDEPQLLGNLRSFDTPSQKKSREENLARLPLPDVWTKWWKDRSSRLRDADGLELVRASLWVNVCSDWEWRWEEWVSKSEERRQVTRKLMTSEVPMEFRYSWIVDNVVDWLLYLHPAAGVVDFGLSALEASLAELPPDDLRQLPHLTDEERSRYSSYYYRDNVPNDWRVAPPFQFWVDALDKMLRLCPSELTPQQVLRRWRLLRWRDEPILGAPRLRPELEVLAAAYAHGGATLADWADQLLGEPSAHDHGRFGALTNLTGHPLDKWTRDYFAAHPEVRELLDRCRTRLLEIELARGEAETPATAPANAINSLFGVEILIRLLAALGQNGFKSSSPYGGQPTSKPQSLTRLASVTYPDPQESPEQVAARLRQAVKSGEVSEERLLQLAFLAPQWARHIEEALGWNGFMEGLYWFLAHMRYVWGATTSRLDSAIESQDSPAKESEQDEDARRPSAWERIIGERTPLSKEERESGAIDMAWFQRTYAQLTPKRWQAMAQAAKFAANAHQARRAQFIADTLYGKTSRRLLLTGVAKKKLKEYVRLLGLLPLASGRQRDKDITERFKALQEYRRYAKTLSSLTKPEALRAVEIGLHNLARTAGYPDPLRLEWELGAAEVRDLGRGPVSLTKSGVTVTLYLDHRAQPQLKYERGEKELKSLPTAVKKDKKIAELTDRVKDLRRQASRMRESLEGAMCRGDEITAAELNKLCSHAILAPLLERLLLVNGRLLGYPIKQGKALKTLGKPVAIKKGDRLRIAHPCDLLASGKWEAWQHECFASERIQPFKQVFRELYVPTKQELRDKVVSRRYAGQQVNEQQANALWGQRGWHTQDGVWKTYYEVGITVSVSFKYGYTTPLEVEGRTIDEVEFSRREEPGYLKLVDAPPRLFSEVMRDLDLVVSVAHVGGVDPEASASTVEMRANLLRETCQLLGIDNLRFKNQHVLIDGQLAKYNVHLGSATVHRMPGGSLCIVPVHAQHRGRLFLPFADDDPRTAELISKVLLLARDDEIQDPIILEQLRRA